MLCTKNGAFLGQECDTFDNGVPLLASFVSAFSTPDSGSLTHETPTKAKLDHQDPESQEDPAPVDPDSNNHLRDP